MDTTRWDELLPLVRRAVPEGEIAELLRSLVRIPSHPQCEGLESRLAEFLAGFLRSEGLDVTVQPVVGVRHNVIARLKGAGHGRSLILHAHMDTVPPYRMEIEPFEGIVQDGKLYGRGAVDVKGGLAAMVMAIVGLRRAGIALRGDVILTAVVDEEFRGEGTEALVLSGLKADGAIVAEPTSLRLCRGHRGLEWLEITVKGVAVHSGTREKGVNAISKAARLVVALEQRLTPKLASRTDPFLGPPTINVGYICGGFQPSTVAESCLIKLDRRTTPLESTALVWKDFHELFDQLAQEDPEFTAEIRRMPESQAKLDHLAFVTPPDHPLVRCLEGAISATGLTPQHAPFPAWSDAGFLAVHGAIPSVVLGPGDLSVAHSALEWVSLEEVVAATQLYALAAMEFCGTVDQSS
ncbi:MAG: M20 family metallopeptidase [Bacillota bacterium]